MQTSCTQSTRNKYREYVVFKKSAYGGFFVNLLVTKIRALFAKNLRTYFSKRILGLGLFALLPRTLCVRESALFITLVTIIRYPLGLWLG
jgi:hypothetical protein